MRIDFGEIEPEEKHNFKGGTGTLHIQAADDGQVRIQRVVVHPGGSLGMHVHEGNCEVVYVVSGGGKVLDGDDEYRLEPGLVTYCPEGKRHSIINDTEDDLELFAVIPTFAK